MWVGVRAMQMSPAEVASPTPLPASVTPPQSPAAPATGRPPAVHAVIAAAYVPPVIPTPLATGYKAVIVPDPPEPPPAPTAPVPIPSPAPASPPMPAQPGFVMPAPPAAALPPRLRGSGWTIVRSGSATPFAPQLGGSQAGMRLTYAIDAAQRFAFAGRLSGALGSRQREAAIGVDWRPTALPIHLVAEQRIGVENARGGPALGLIGGIGPTPLAGALQLDVYAQGGAIARDGIEGFVDGAIRIARPVAAIGPARIELGLGAWGAAQRGAARFDAGPSASIALPVAGGGLRLSLDWRQRLAGRATPASGPALSLGTDF